MELDKMQAGMFAAALAAMSLIPQNPDRLDWWREARFGMFIHWGIYSVPAGEYRGETRHAEWIMETAKVPMAEYRQWRDQFNPVQFDADEWARMAAEAGMKYLVLTTKHHDGFCLFPTETTDDWDIERAPYQRDIVRQVVDACRKRGIRIGFYHSIMEWSSPDWGQPRPWAVGAGAQPDMDRFEARLHQMVTELLTNYGPIDIMWFDGEWESPWTVERGQRLQDLCRRLQPQMIINNRVGPGRDGMDDHSMKMGDFGTPEQMIPAEGIPGLDWESCMTMNGNWGWNRADKNWKSSVELVRNLSDVASKGGNYLLNIGPTAEGLFPPEAVERLAEIGAWMKVNGEAIYGAKASPVGSYPWGRATAKDGRLYLHVWTAPEGGRLELENLASRPSRARLLGGADLGVEPSGWGWSVAAPAMPANGMPAVVELSVEGGIQLLPAPVLELPSGFVGEAPIRAATSIEGAELRFTIDGSAPTAASPVLDSSSRLAESGTVRVRAFKEGRAIGPEARRAAERLEWLLPAQAAAPEEAGWTGRVYEGRWDRLPDFSLLAPVQTFASKAIGLGPAAGRENVGLVYEGWMHLESDQILRFRLASDDGSRLLVGGRMIVDNDGLHPSLEKAGLAALRAGWHRVRIEWFNAAGGADLRFQFEAAG